MEKAKRFIYDHIRSQTIPEMAANLAVSANTLRRFIAKNHLPSPSSSPDRESNDTEVKKRIAAAINQYKSGAPSKLPASLIRKRRSPAESMQNAIERMEHHGKIPRNINKPATREENDDRAAYIFISRHEWTEAEIEALPEVPQAVIRAYLKIRQEGGDLKRTAKEAHENAIARMEHHERLPPQHQGLRAKLMTQDQKNDKAATQYVRRHQWTQAEIDALPVVSRAASQKRSGQAPREKKEREVQESNVPSNL